MGRGRRRCASCPPLGAAWYVGACSVDRSTWHPRASGPSAMPPRGPGPLRCVGQVQLGSDIETRRGVRCRLPCALREKRS
eukprot:5261164-Prymnesium_polylepis.3